MSRSYKTKHASFWNGTVILSRMSSTIWSCTIGWMRKNQTNGCVARLHLLPTRNSIWCFRRILPAAAVTLAGRKIGRWFPQQEFQRTNMSTRNHYRGLLIRPVRSIISSCRRMPSHPSFLFPGLETYQFVGFGFVRISKRHPWQCPVPADICW